MKLYEIIEPRLLEKRGLNPLIPSSGSGSGNGRSLLLWLCTRMFWLENTVYNNHSNRFTIFNMFISSPDDDETHQEADLLNDEDSGDSISWCSVDRKLT